MEHLYPGLIEPVSEIIENLIALPRRCRKQRSDDAKEPPSTEHTEGSRCATQGARHRRKKELEKKEEALLGYERSLVSRAAQLASDELAFREQKDACRIHKIPVSQITVGALQPRRTFDDLSLFSLSESIRKHGVLQPLTIRRLPDATAVPSPMYELICGERRLRAAESVGMEEVPCILLDCKDTRCAELALIENLQRDTLDPFEAAAAIASLIDMHAMTQEELAGSLSVSQSYIANKLRILRLTESEREIISQYHLTERHARTFLRLKSLKAREAAIRYVAEHHLTVAQTEAYIDRLMEDAVAAHEEAPAPKEEKKQHHTLIIKDMRLFFNTVDHAVDTMREAGIPVESTRMEENGEITMRIVLPSAASGQANDRAATAGKEEQTSA